MSGSILFVADVLFLCGIKDQIANGSHQTIDTEGDHGEKNVGKRSGCIARGLEAGVIDDDASNPAKEKCEQKTNKIVIAIHFVFLQKK